MGTETLGIDIGGVIMRQASKKTEISIFSDRYLKTPEIPGAVDAIRALAARFGDRIFLVSKASESTEARIRAWLEHRRFSKRTGIHPERFHFCRERSDKAGICRTIEATHFIDDRLEVLGYLLDIPHRLLFHPNEREIERFRQHLPGVVRVEGWAEVLAQLPPR